jgi:hypothetical protein
MRQQKQESLLVLIRNICKDLIMVRLNCHCNLVDVINQSLLPANYQVTLERFENRATHGTCQNLDEG